MAITSYSQRRYSNVTTVTVVSDLTPPSGGAVYYHWYIDGAYVAMTRSSSRSFALEAGDQVKIVAQDTTDPDYDAVANAPAGYPARRSLWWLRSLDDDVEHYRVEQRREDDNDWSVVAIVRHDNRVWSYSLLTGRLDDLIGYAWRVVPVDLAGNDGTPWELATEMIVRTPDAPDFAVTFDDQTTCVTFASAA